MSSYSTTKQNYLEILKTFFMALIFLGIGSYIGVKFIPPTFRYYMNLAFVVVILFSMFSKKGGFIRTKASMYIYALILGILTGSTYIYYFYNLGAGTFISVVLGVILIFAMAYIVASRSTEEKLFSMTPMIFGGIFVLFILEIINIFIFKFGTFDIILSAIGIGIYSIYAMVIMKSIQVRCRYGTLSESEVVNLAYSVFISFLNLLLDLLRLVSIINRED
ncbi:Bax inhibitor-1 family protein [Clostridium sp.]|uniref:Bax inhibitor-1 family protein n=1 Tax=Clostridium sp. TaxID=1506 RepID=UPI003F362BD6